MTTTGEFGVFDILFKSVMKNPIAWFIFVSFFIVINTVGWYYRFSLFGDAFNKTGGGIMSAMGDLGGIIMFRIFEYICIFGFAVYLFKYAK
jgi:hypothetical protein